MIPQNINIIAVHPTIFATAIHVFVVIYRFIQTSVSRISKIKFNSSISIIYYFRPIKDRARVNVFELRF